MKRFVPGTLVFSVTLIGLAGCGAKEPNPEKRAVATLPTVQVRVESVQSKARPITEEVVGTVRAKLRATVEARVSGRIDRLPVLLGEKVQKGQLIARLDAAEIVARLEQAEASLEQAEREWKRVSALHEQQGVTRAEFDAAESRRRVARAVAAEANAMMGYVQIVAPFQGVVTKKWADVGDLAAPGKPLIEIEDSTGLQLETDVPEAIASYVRKGARLRVRVDAVRDELEAVVSEVGPAADPLTRTFRVKLDLPSMEGLMPGQFARLIVPIGERKSIRVPTTAVVRRGQMEIVFCVTNQHAQLHLVKTGKCVGDEVEILSGLDSGQTVVVSSADQLTDGQPVEAK